MFDFSFHNILHSNIFNFVIMVLILYKLCAPLISKGIRNANNKTAQIVNDSVESKEQSLRKLEAAKTSYANTPKETQEIEKIAQNTIESLKQKTKNDINSAKQIIEDNANKSVQTEFAKINAQLTKETAEKSVQIALEKIKNQLSEDATLHDKLIEDAIDKLETI